jgi:cold shock CspA family protein
MRKRFIAPDDGTDDIFVHQSEILDGGGRGVHSSTAPRFPSRWNKARGPRAVCVQSL